MLEPALQKNEEIRLQALLDLGLLNSEAEERFDRITRLAASYFDVTHCAISLVDVDRQWFKSRVGLNFCETDRKIAFCAHTILQDDIMIVGDARKDPRFSDNPLVINAPYTVFYAGAPLRTNDGYKIGTLCLFDDKPATLNTHQLSALRDFADLVEQEINGLSQKQLQKDRHEAALRTQQMLAVFPDIVFIVETDGLDNFRYLASNNHPDLYLPKDQFIGKTIDEVLPQDIGILFKQSLAETFKTGDLIHFHYQLVLSGTPNFFEARARQISDSEALVIVRNTTEKRERMRELERLSMVAEQTTNSVIITDKNRKVLWVNKAFTEVTGYTSDEMLGKNPGTILQGAETNPETVQFMREALAHQNSYSVDIINYHKNGKPYWVRIVCNPWLDERSVFKGYIAIQSDITQEIQNLEEIKQNQRLLSAVIDANEIGTWILNLQTRTLEINESWAKLLGYTLDELSPVDMDTWQDLTHPDDLEKCLKMFEDYDKRVIDYYEAPIRMKHKDGYWLWVRTRGSVTTRTKDDKAEFTLGTHLNIHAQKIAEMQLQEQYDYMQVIFDNMIDGTVIIDAQENIQSYNPSAGSMFGYSREEAIDQHIGLLIPKIDDAFFSGTLQYSEGKRKDGDIFPMEVAFVKSKFKQKDIFIGMLRDITQRKNAEEEIHKLAYFDGLTRLPNRRLMLDRLQQALLKSVRSSQHVAILFIDFDNFKQINDSAGHDIGDFLLQQIANRLRKNIRETDTVARLGGDEFVVILEDLDKHPDQARKQAQSTAQNLKRELNQSYAFREMSYTGSCSIGITVCSDPSLSSAEFIKQADLAMYQAKLAGKDAIRFFATEMQEKVDNRISVEQDLRNALSNEEFEVFYQTQVDEYGACLGAEALLRWNHPSRGLVPPIEFIPIAEESGLIIPIGQWVLKQACSSLVAWSSEPDMAHLNLAVNTSAVELSQDDWVQNVFNILDETGADPNKLKLEVTESVMAFDIGKVITKLSALRERGVYVSLDDFGTGYSSLTYLKRLPLDQLKIDKSFVRDILVDPNDKAIAQTIINLANIMELDVLAEGVETQEQLTTLLSMGCSVFQGYYFNKPVPHEIFKDHLDTMPKAASTE